MVGKPKHIVVDIDRTESKYVKMIIDEKAREGYKHVSSDGKNAYFKLKKQYR